MLKPSVGKRPQQDRDIPGSSLAVATVKTVPLMLYIGRYGEYLRGFLLSLKSIPCVWEWKMSV